MRFWLLLAAFHAGAVLAQYDGPAVESCRAYAAQETKKPVVFERDRFLLIERYTRKIGSQFVSSVLTGNGAVVYPGTPTAELSFLCLLADEKRPVFFAWLPRMDTSALAQCTRDESLRGKPLVCLQTLAQLAAQDLGLIQAQRFQEATGRGDDAVAALRKSNDEWLQYREAECRRSRELGAVGSLAERELACVIDLTRRRALDMR
jgi:uncharacterized protein YecT (DUF1311 family)